MKRLHIHIGVDNLAQGIDFYSHLFAAPPTTTRADYAKWMLDDPRVNFAISTRVAAGVDHLGLQVDDADELAALRAGLREADLSLFDEGETQCCYARSDKSWVQDPAGIPWEAFQSMEELQLFAAGADPKADTGNCCTPAADSSGCCTHAG